MSFYLRREVRTMFSSFSPFPSPFPPPARLICVIYQTSEWRRYGVVKLNLESEDLATNPLRQPAYMTSPFKFHFSGFKNEGIGTEPARLEPMLRNKRGHDSERPAHRDEEWSPLATAGENRCTEMKTQHSQK